MKYPRHISLCLLCAGFACSDTTGAHHSDAGAQLGQAIEGACMTEGVDLDGTAGALDGGLSALPCRQRRLPGA